VEIGAEDVSDEQAALSRLVWLQQSGGLSQGTGNQIIQEVAAQRAMRQRCLMLAEIHRRLSFAYALRARATTADMIEAADRSIGNLQAELKHAES
jgi:hypothetical protein